jgi:hypothetical protein
LENSTLKSSVLVFETAALGSALLVGHELLNSGWSVVEFKIPRSGNSSVALMMTSDLELSDGLKTSLESQPGKLTLLPKVSKTLVEYFDFSIKG